MPCAERFVQVLPLGEREDASREGNVVAFNDNPPVVDGVVWEEDGLQHFRGGLATDRDTGFNRALQVNGLLDGDQRADAHIGQALNGLDDDFDILALLMGGAKERQVAQLRQHPAQLRLEDHQHRQDEEGGDAGQEVLQYRQLQQVAGHYQCQQHHQKPGHHRRTACAPHKPKGRIDAHRED